jgi:hypothetical protein
VRTIRGHGDVVQDRPGSGRRRHRRMENGTWQYTLPGRMKTGDQGLNKLTVPSQERNGGIRDV